MSVTTLKKFLMALSDQELLDVYNELSVDIVPKAGAAHKLNRRINDLIERGFMKVREDQYRCIYLPTLSRYVMSEMARRYADLCIQQVTMEDVLVPNDQLTLEEVLQQRAVRQQLRECMR